MSTGLKVSLYWIFGILIVFTLLTLRAHSEAKRQVEQSQALVQTVQGYVDVVERYSRIAGNPTDCGVTAALFANEMSRSDKPDATIAYFENLLPKVKSETVQRAIRFQLVDLYRKAGQKDKALDQLQMLMLQAQ